MKVLPLFLLLFPSVLFAQKHGRALGDSMLKELSKYKEDTNRVSLLVGISFTCYAYDPQAGIKYGEDGLALAEKLNWKRGIAGANNSIGINYMQQADNDKALEYFQKSLRINEEAGNKKKMAQNLGNIGLLYNNQSDYPRALEYMFKALKICEEVNDKEDIAKQLGNIGNIYHAQKNFLKALHYDSLALHIYYEQKDKTGIAIDLGNMGNIYEDLGDHEKALLTCSEALKMCEESGMKKSIGINLTNIGRIYSSQQHYYKALASQFKALEIFQELGAQNLIGNSLGNIGEYYLDIANDTSQFQTDRPASSNNKNYLKLSIDYLQKAIVIVKKTNDLSSLADDLHNLSKAQKVDGNYKDALESYQQYILVKDSVFNKENNIKINNLEHRRELDLKESQIKILAQENNVKDLRAEKEVLTRKLLIAGIIVLIIFAFSIGAYYIRRQKNEKLIANEKMNTLLKEQELRSVNNMLEAQELERKRIAADLHDRLGSMLSTVRLYFNLLEEQVDKLTDQNQDQYHKAISLLDDACNEVRKISHDLVSGELVKLGLVSALNQMKETIKNTGKLKMNVLVFGMEKRLDSSVETTLYRIIQELMNNVLKHSEANEVTIQLNKVDHNLNIVAEDDGIGFDVRTSMTKDGMGLKNIETRIKKLNGTISIDSGKGKGTTTIIDIPV